MAGAAGLGGTRGVWMRVAVVMLLTPAVLNGPGSHTQPSHLKKVLPHAAIIQPQWLQPNTERVRLGDKHPARVELLVTVERRDLILSLRRNQQLINPNYTETHYGLTDAPIIRTPNMTEHCYYHGDVRGEVDSSAVISTCSGIRGLITLSANQSYVVEPLPGEDGSHVIYKAELLDLGEMRCGHPAPGNFSALTSHAGEHHQRVKREDPEGDRCVELYLVADYAEFQKHNSDLEQTQRKMLEVTNYIDKFYRSLNIRIALVGLEIWSNGDKCNVSENPYSTLRAFLSWRRKLLKQIPHDNAQLITGRAFQGTTIGLAPLQAMCSSYQSGGVNMDHSDNAIGVAATMAHEIGHNFGMSHDAAGCCTARPEDGGCIMAAATGHPFPKTFNACNRRELNLFLRSGGGMCLGNAPDTKTLYGGVRCGNGFLEEGEQCDCGDLEQCNNPCCNATTCTLTPGADCAHGTCCHQCKLRPPGFPCRKPSRPCDLPEFCTGRSAVCPQNSFQLDGTSCHGGQAFCYNGRCLTHQEQCRQLWGKGARSAPDACYQMINAAGDQYGNCGRDLSGEYRKCEAKDARCGKVQCQTSAAKPLENNAVAIDTTITMDGRQVLCRGTHFYRASEEEDTMDPGLVLTGTKCGENQICFDGQCRNTSFLQADECAKKCHGNGVCNNNQNCHCFPGWQPPYCNQTGNGGSMDSGPVPAERPVAVALWTFMTIALLAGMAFSVSIYRYKHRAKHRSTKPDWPPATGSLSKSDSQEKPNLDSSYRQRPQEQSCSKSPVTSHYNLKEGSRTSIGHQPRQPEGGATKPAGPIRIPPPSRPAPPPPVHPKISDPPRRAPPVPPNRTRHAAAIQKIS
ncbi:disintegrin and metalloproteinase domain-containing protein 19 [Spea bombifrons]|uniref:disintegrin and metalloproteinase domain-containing protein 19 n=1 Tax=Spea bombifrons TaxID=233779 RepID=UPI002348F297|nr:disintegrin and metalloproteinase domain-containing protein 19 [Spea bombifrons]